jgi:hypothetical protein
MRKSLNDIKHMIKEIQYKGVLPDELRPYHTYLVDSGHSIMCVLECHLENAKNSSMDDYELPVPVKYVIENGYRIIDQYVIVHAEYDQFIGLTVDDKYTEY